jgi:hypothetical protein
VGEYHGLYEDHLVVDGITFDRQIIIIDGRPLRTKMNMEELISYITEQYQKELEEELEKIAEEKRSAQLVGVDQIAIEKIVGGTTEDKKEDESSKDPKDSAVSQVVLMKSPAEETYDLVSGNSFLQSKIKAGAKTVEAEIICQLTKEEEKVWSEREHKLRSEAKEILELVGKPPIEGEIYKFPDAVVIHHGHIDKPLREYGSLHDPTQFVHIVGSIDKLAAPVDLGGRAFPFYFFDPYDFDEKGGHLTIQVLGYEEKMAIADWVSRSVKIASVLKLKQVNKSLKLDKQVLQESLKTKSDQVGEQKRRIMELEIVAGHAGRFSISSALLTLLVSVLAPALLLGGLGVIIGLALPQQISCAKPIYNATSGVQTGCLETIANSNPAALQLPIFLMLGGLFLGVLLAMRHYRGRM